jgi:hypothetical protein
MHITGHCPCLYGTFVTVGVSATLALENGQPDQQGRMGSIWSPFKRTPASPLTRPQIDAEWVVSARRHKMAEQGRCTPPHTPNARVLYAHPIRDEVCWEGLVALRGVPLPRASAGVYAPSKWHG